jgi:arsenate-mycothiol transferase
VTSRTPAVLFICVSNAGKSVMAQHLMRHAAGDSITALSAGTNAKTGVNALSAQALAELSIDISGHRPTQLTVELIRATDLVVIVGSQARIDSPPECTPVRTWDTEEPSLRGIEGIERMRLIRDEIAHKVQTLINELLPAPSWRPIPGPGTASGPVNRL